MTRVPPTIMPQTPPGTGSILNHVMQTAWLWWGPIEARVCIAASFGAFYCLPNTSTFTQVRSSLNSGARHRKQGDSLPQTMQEDGASNCPSGPV